ncbi:MAG: biotin/lipoyl-containing protein [bacterium]
MLIKISDDAKLKESRKEGTYEPLLAKSAPWLRRETLGIFILIVDLLIGTLFSTPAWAIRATGGEGQVRITWIAPTRNVDGTALVDLAGYNIYRGITREEQNEKVNNDPVCGCTFLDTGLKNGQTYFYCVTAVDFSGNESIPSDPVFATPSIMPPAEFTAIGDDGKVKLFWDDSGKSSVRGYHLYRSRSRGGDYQKITDVPLECAYFEDLKVKNGLNYYYVISSVDEYGMESPRSEEMGATPVTRIPIEPSDLKATFEVDVVKLEWPESSDPEVAGYHVYRRNSIQDNRFQKLTSQLLIETSFTDDSIEINRQYLYSVVSVDKKGTESKFPLEVACRTQSLYIASITEDTEGKAKKADDKIVFIMKGEPGCKATFTIEGLAENQPMEEISLGVYHQEFSVPAGTNLNNAQVTGYLADTQGNKALKKAAGNITIKNDPPPPVQVISGTINYGWPQITWTPPDAKTYSSIEIYRSTSAFDPGFPQEPAITIAKGTSTFIDEKADAGAIYYYVARTVDEAGNRSEVSKAVKIDLGERNESPAIYSVKDDTEGIPVKTGRIIRVVVEGDRGCDASFSLKEIGGESSSREIIQWQSLNEVRPGIYRGEYQVKSQDQTTEKGADLVARLLDQAKKERFAKGEKPLRINVHSDDKEPPKIARVEFTGHKEATLTSKLVAGNVLCVHLIGDPGEIAFFSLGPEGKKIPMTESKPGEYEGTYTIRTGDDAEKINVYGYLTDQAGNLSSKASETALSIDTRLIITVTTNPKDLYADDNANAKVVVRVEDINKNPVSNHHLALTLATTDEYTDVIGGGGFDNQKPDGKVAIDFDSVTDNYGQITAVYTAGNAAKTALIIAKDLNTGLAGVGYITSYIESSLNITLKEKVWDNKQLLSLPDGDAVYMILEADPQKITADGRSRSRITVRLLDKYERPVTKPYRVTFSLTQGEGHLSPQTITTGATGSGYTYYEAGKRVLTAIVNVAAIRVEEPNMAQPLHGIISVTLMSDAPAKLIITADSTILDAGSGQLSHIKFTVSDINDNRNPQATIQLKLQDSQGNPSRNGQLYDPTLETDHNGEASCIYRAGYDPGLVQIMAKVSSRVPTPEELLRAKGSLFVPLWDEEEASTSRFSWQWQDERIKDCRGTIREWFKMEGDEVKKGEPLALIEIEKHGDVVLKAPGDGELIDIKVLQGEEVQIGQTIGYVEIKEERFP